MSRHALEVLEFERVLQRIAGRASSSLGRERTLSLCPRAERTAVVHEIGRVESVVRFVEERPEWAPGPVPDVREALARLAVPGAALEPSDLHGVGVLLGSSRLLRKELGARADRHPELVSSCALLVERPDLEETIARCVDAEGHVLDSASRELARIRKRLRGAHSRIVRRLETYLGSLPERLVVPDASVTLREGRYVIPVRREGRGDVGGIVHDESQTGATLYVEPPAAIELMNELRDLEREETREVRRVLAERTAALAPERDALSGALEALVDFDSLHARARTARAWGAAAPQIREEGEHGLSIRQGRHPLLVEGGEDGVVAFDLELDDEERALVVSGPNTGGKSVFLKAVGLIAALTQSGVVPPVGRGTRLPVFGTFFADIGDEQSIARSLSTFAAHLVNLSDIVTRADERSLVLIDEMGTGTDPAEGAALARAVLEELIARNATTIVSSHLGELKSLDTEASGIVNASLQFDAERMEPTYRLVKGRPGRSYGLAIARRLGLPHEVLDRAERHRDAGAARMEEVLARLERQEREAERLVEELERERGRTSRLREELEGRAHELSEAERTADERARLDARKLLLDARAEVEAAIGALRLAAEDERADMAGAARDARRRVEEAAGRLKGDAGRREPSGRRLTADAGKGPGGRAAPSRGDRVRIQATGAEGRVAEVRSGRALVEAGAVRLEVPVGDLEVLEGSRPGGAVSGRARQGGTGAREARGGWSGRAADPVRLEVDLRGMRVDEMEIELSRALDQAVLEDLSELRVIHGKGTGALRQRVGELLEHDARVKAFGMAVPNQGGAGVTIARFRDADHGRGAAPGDGS